MKKYELTTIQGKDIVIDISELLKQEVLYLNVTKLATQFGKSRQNQRKFFLSETFLEYEKALFKVNQIDYFKTEKKGLKYSVKGKYGGTYLHVDLLIIFLRWLNPEFAVICDLYLKQIIQKIHDEKSKDSGKEEANHANLQWTNARNDGKNTRKLLTDKIKEFCKYAETQRGKLYNKCPYYKHVTDAIYSVIGVPVPKGCRTPRDVYSGDIVEAIESAELETIILLDEVMESNGSRKGIKALIMDWLA